MIPCECRHFIVRFAKLRAELKPLEYCDEQGNPIDPDWLTITHNQIGKCHGSSEGYSMEYRREDGSVITWEDFRALDHAIATMEKWHRVAASEWCACHVADSDQARPWMDNSPA